MTLRPFLCAFLIAASSAAADPASEALFKEGKAKYEAGEYVAALENFRQAYARTRSPAAMLSIGTTLKALGRFAEAADAYEAYLADPGANPAKKAETQKALLESLKSVATLKIDAETNANVTVDAREVKGSVRVDPGAHVVIADDGSGNPMTTQITVKAGEERTVSLRRKADGSPPATGPSERKEPREPPATPQPARRPGSGGGGGIPVLSYVLVGTGILAGGVAVYAGVQSRGKYSDAGGFATAKLECNGAATEACRSARSADINRANDDGDQLQRVTIVAGAVGVAAVVSGILVAVFTRSADDAMAARPPALTVSAGPGTAGVSLGGLW